MIKIVLTESILGNMQLRATETIKQIILKGVGVVINPDETFMCDGYRSEIEFLDNGWILWDKKVVEEIDMEELSRRVENE